MSLKQTQIEIISNKLLNEGFITNLWCINNQIWRLGARIEELRQDGWDIETIYANRKGERNTTYKLIKSPYKQVQYSAGGKTWTAWEEV